ncbi:histone-lysine N-methyltransferase Smyd1 [Striga asiatica]|uniref:Histone-lysine N-methyltransferase Smyd1 n=1 Tax=Striga asiatica TaxID=4170 RepID=A0A5A7Q9N7_STRAF|nr:histone-lysine N-methyltransferase Smyd1 [Striga asiatica]
MRICRSFGARELLNIHLKCVAAILWIITLYSSTPPPSKSRVMSSYSIGFSLKPILGPIEEGPGVLEGPILGTRKLFLFFTMTPGAAPTRSAGEGVVRHPTSGLSLTLGRGVSHDSSRFSSLTPNLPLSVPPMLNELLNLFNFISSTPPELSNNTGGVRPMSLTIKARLLKGQQFQLQQQQMHEKGQCNMRNFTSWVNESNNWLANDNQQTEFPNANEIINNCATLAEDITWNDGLWDFSDLLGSINENDDFQQNFGTTNY